MTIGGVEIAGRFLLAPLSGISDGPMRLICRRMGAGMVYSEMASSEALVRDGEKTLRLVDFRDEERPIALQLFGARPEVFARAARRLAEREPDVIDINAGCPAKKVVRSGSGAALMRDLSLLGEVAAALVESVGCPVTAKIRSGWDAATVNAPEAAVTLCENGVSAVAVHPRTRAQQYKGSADWSLIREVKAAVPVPVFGSGDVRVAPDAMRMLETTGCDAVLIGRAALGNPWVFRMANELHDSGSFESTVGARERIRQCIEHLDLMVEEKGERTGVFEMRKHLVAYLKGFPGASGLRYELVRTCGHQAVRETLVTALSRHGLAPAGPGEGDGS